MRYMGSKARHAKHIIPIMMKDHDLNNWYVEPFVGGGNMIDKVQTPLRMANDSNKYAVALLEAVSNGWEPPEHLSEEQYAQIKENKDKYTDHLIGFAGFSCSYSGKFFGGYWRSDNKHGRPRNGAAEQKRALLKQAKGLRDILFFFGSYLELGIPHGSTVYCDPPYEGTTKYKDEFNHDVFWRWAEEESKRCRVFVSEYVAPEGWDCVWEKSVSNSLTKNTGAKKGVEKLFTRK